MKDASMRYLLAFLFLLITAPAFAQEQCVSVDQVVALAKERNLGISVYTGQEAEAIKAGMAQMGAALEGRRIFMVLSDGSGVDLLIGFKDGCHEGSARVPHKFIDAWLAGTES